MMTPAAMNCQQLVELVTDYLEGALPEDECRSFERHLDNCDGCTEYLAQMRRTIATLGALRPEHLSPEAERELLAFFRDWNQR
jgi:anti-sigma factor RsiW